MQSDSHPLCITTAYATVSTSANIIASSTALVPAPLSKHRGTDTGPGFFAGVTHADHLVLGCLAYLCALCSMRTLSSHLNVLALKDALELVQDTKATIFLVLELARGGELFDRIQASGACGTDVSML